MPRFRSEMASTPRVGVGMGLGSLTSSRPPAPAAVHEVVAPAPLPLLLPLPPAPGASYSEPGSQATKREAKVREARLTASVDVRYMVEDGARGSAAARAG